MYTKLKVVVGRENATTNYTRDSIAFETIDCYSQKNIKNENAPVSHLPRVNGVESSTSTDLTIMYDLDQCDLGPRDLDIRP